MITSLADANEELKRVDHQIFVSLKYTRTVDVLLNIISRMIDAYDFMMEALLKYALQKNMIAEIPGSPQEKGTLVKSIFQEELVQNNINLYFLLRKIHKSNYQKENEYRRHVTLITFINGKQEVVNIDNITEYYSFQKEFFHYVEKLVREAEE